ncbi:MAG TPA: ubiquinone/menaquinone biosynthesis methyltransferase, partial [Alphaproteobacteria bacterium]|nr:ubiquinone/menaquinone biosynthesis methyltransferase [Alphaproteobacteria bacterium]
QTLPFEDNTFDHLTISFGLRNISQKEQALKEFYRVLKPGGHFYCLEFSKVEQAHLKKLYEFYSFQIIPILGKLVAQDEQSYRYLVESIQRFLDPSSLKEMIQSVGFTSASFEPLSFGVVAIHHGQK